MLDITKKPVLNGIDLQALDDTVAAIQADPAVGVAGFRVRTEWQGQTRSRSTVEGFSLGGQEIARRFTIEADEPTELLGTNTAPNPQELLMAAVNACMTVGYVAQASVLGVTLEACTIEMSGKLDLRGFLGLDDEVAPGYRQMDYTVTLKGDGTREQYEEIHRAVQATSPNFFNMARPIAMRGTLA